MNDDYDYNNNNNNNNNVYQNSHYQPQNNADMTG